MDSITFFYPSKTVGGAEFLFLRLAEQVSKLGSVRVKYIDYRDGFAKSRIESNGLDIDIIEFCDHKKIAINYNTVVITPLSNIFEVNNYLRGLFKLYFWSIHPFGLKDAIVSNHKYSLFSNPRMDRYGKDIDFLLSKNGLTFMDGSNLYYQQETFKFKTTVDDFTPIFCPARKGGTRKINEEEVNLGWLGRLDKDKIYTVKNIISHIQKFCEQNKNIKIVFHIIGDGKERVNLSKVNTTDNFSMVLINTLLDDELTEYANNKVDVFFAMGTSSLELASMGKPVVLVDLMDQEVGAVNRFKWIYNSKYFSVGTPFTIVNENALSFENIILNINNDDLEVIGNLSRQYYLKNHTIDIVVDKILKAVSETTLTSCDLKKTKLRCSFFFSKIKLIKRFFKV
ncbi:MULTISPECIES: glycosyltransferase [Sphingobacterium]|uniref:glycosyltransferase n=1 Tax=Sphingobacterium TaxID=28453 RepID=UPI0013DABFE3|nr:MULTISPECIES: glycosyltransferase [unclassified Sphingobacterium]